MRKLVFVLMLAISFALGTVSQNLIAGNWVFPTESDTPPLLVPGQYASDGVFVYTAPIGWKTVGANGLTDGKIIVQLMKLE